MKKPDLFQRVITSALGMMIQFQKRMDEARREAGWIQHVGWTPAIRGKAESVAASCRLVQVNALAVYSGLKHTRKELRRLEADEIDDLDALREALRLTEVREVDVVEDLSSVTTYLTMSELWTRLNEARDDTKRRLSELSHEIRDS
jgi:hypothetical protein